MPIDRLEIMLKALARPGVEVGMSTRYANDSGTCLRCVTGTMVMVPDGPGLPVFMQADGADELKKLVDPVFDALAAEAEQAAVASGARGALLEAADALYQEGYDAGLEAGLAAAREMFETVVAGEYGAMPPSVSGRIRSASFADLARWARQLSHARHVTSVTI